ncbi:nucleoside monophosphate kinase [Rubinisphaera sp.]|uniref:adenylate kinase family protein n=1 Tax=Rubinisphaera sp. TaxID=2024857 RepID=UPI000C103F10|nr:nucleoside monophosphate kinase [Rubinisphaera sp.]MBV11096.1 adenylate kinase [Rubinisphaera sp.]|tara:strand:+ start:3266 stop:3922 length:657 start_codon:yes stop_codon:yes gene_type:complete
MHKYVIMGMPGCGKGTQSEIMCKRFSLVHISVGDILRWNIKNHTKMAARIKRLMSTGRLIPDEFVENIVQHRLQEHDWNYGFMLDGFPRNEAQAEFFLESYDIDAVIYIDVPAPLIIERLGSRRVCGNCGATYNLVSAPPKVAGICDACGSKELIRRPDDNEVAIRERLLDYEEKTLPALNLFRRKELVITVRGDRPINEVQADIQRDLNLAKYRIKS